MKTVDHFSSQVVISPKTISSLFLSEVISHQRKLLVETEKCSQLNSKSARKNLLHNGKCSS